MLKFETNLIGNFTNIRFNGWFIFADAYVYDNSTYAFFLRKIKKDVSKILLKFNKNIIIDVKTRSCFNIKCFCDVNITLQNSILTDVKIIEKSINDTFQNYIECQIQTKR